MHKWKKRIAFALATILLGSTADISTFSVAAEVIEEGTQESTEGAGKNTQQGAKESTESTEDNSEQGSEENTEGTVETKNLGTAFAITGTNLVEGVDYTYSEEESVLMILSNKSVAIANIDPTTAIQNRIEVADGVSANIILAGVHIDFSKVTGKAAFKIPNNSTGNVTITLADNTTNILKSGNNCAGLQKNGDSSSGLLTIQGEGTEGKNGNGKLEVTGGKYGAGIGGGYKGIGSNITICGGEVTATGGEEGAGIGGGKDVIGSDITISGGIVTANGGAGSSGAGAGIGGGGLYAAGTRITIKGGEVRAVGATYAAGIGGSRGGAGSEITISGGIVTAIGGESSAGIGGGTRVTTNIGTGSEITIRGGTVTAIGGESGAGIGGGRNSQGSNIQITGGSVKATAGKNAHGIGGGHLQEAVIPTDEVGNHVYLMEIENMEGMDIQINGVDYPDKHIYTDAENQIFEEKKIYVYLSGKTAQTPEQIKVGETVTKHCYDTTNEKWLTVVDVLEVDNTSYIYNGNPQTYGIVSNEDYTVEGGVQTDAGTYIVTATLKENRSWSDGTTETKEYEFIIDRNTPEVTEIPSIFGRYGQALADMELSKIEIDDDHNISGTWSITQADKENIYPAVDTDALYEITFTPADTKNYNTVTKTVPITVEKKELRVIGVTAEDRFFNGENTVVITDVILEGIVGEDEVSVNVEGLQGIISSANVGTYTKVTLPDLTLTGVDEKNYTLVQPQEAVATEVTIEKCDTEMVVEISKGYIYTKETPDTIVLEEYLPDNCGTITYKELTTTGNITYSIEPTLTDGILSYTVTGSTLGDTEMLEHTGTITQVIETQNYEDIILTVNVTFVDQKRVQIKDNGMVTLDNHILVYGEPLSNLTFQETVFEDEEGQEILGTLAWKEPYLKPNVKTTSANWVFTPEDITYQTIEGTVDIIVNKATPVIVSVEASAITEGETLEVSQLSGLAQHSVSDVNVLEGSFTWKDRSVKPQVSDSNTTEYEIIFTPADGENYNIVNGAVKLTVQEAIVVEPPTGDNPDHKEPEGDNSGSQQPEGQKPEGEQKEIQTAKEELSDFIKDVAVKESSTYTKESFEEFQKALKEAQFISQKINVTKAELLEAQKKLEVAVQSLVLVENDNLQQPMKPGTKFQDPKGIYQFKIGKKGEAIFTGVTKSIPIVKIANTVTYGGKIFKVTAVSSKALKGDKIVTRIAVGKNVKTIGASAFEGCTKLKKITLKNQTTKIGNKVLKDCKSLKKVTIPVKVTILGKSVLEGCRKLSTITIKATGLKKVGKNTFKGIASKARIKVPKKKFTKYKKLLKNKGQGKKVIIK